MLTYYEYKCSTFQEVRHQFIQFYVYEYSSKGDIVRVYKCTSDTPFLGVAGDGPASTPRDRECEPQPPRRRQRRLSRFRGSEPERGGPGARGRVARGRQLNGWLSRSIQPPRPSCFSAFIYLDPVFPPKKLPYCTVRGLHQS